MLRIQILVAFILGLSSFSVAQERTGVWDEAFQTASDAADLASGKSVFNVARPDVIIQIKHHTMGTDIFEISTVIPNYPPELLQAQVEKLCSILNVPARGLQVIKAGISGDSKVTTTRATFGTAGIINLEQGIVNLEPILQAFAGASEPNTVDGITIMFNEMKATPHMLRSFSSTAVRLQAISNENPPVVEYRVQLLSQDPAAIKVPSSAESEQKAPPVASTVQQKGVDWTLWIALIGGAVAAATLVYFLMLRTSTKPRP
jgi:hypothetical protein